MNNIIKTIICYGLLTMVYTQLFAQVKFQKHYNSGSNPEYFINAHQISNGGYIATGISNNVSGSTEQFLIVELDMFGNKINEKGFGESHKNFGYYFVDETDSSYIMAGGLNANSGNSEDIVLFSLKKDFSQVFWTRRVGGSGSGREVTRLIEKKHDGYYGIGWTNSFGSGWQNYMYKINFDGTFAWSSSWGGSGTEKGEAIALTNDGGIVVAGEQSSSAIHGADAIVYKFNAGGDTLQWCKTYSATLGESASAITQTKDGHYVVSGIAHRANASSGGWLYDLFLMKIDSSNGNVIWNRTYGDTMMHFTWWMGRRIIELEDSSLVLGGTRRTGSNGFDAFLIKTDKNGDLLWSRRYGSSSNEDIYDVTPTQDGGFLLSGRTNGFGAGSNYNCYVIKTDGDGYSGCHEVDSLLAQRSLEWSSASRSFTINTHTNTTTGGSLKTASVTAITECIANDGSSCANAYLLTEADYNNTVFTMTDTVMWFKFVAEDSLFNITFSPEDSLSLFEKGFLYFDNCSVLTLIDSTILESDISMYSLFNASLVENTMYLYKLTKSNFDTIRFTPRVQNIATYFCSDSIIPGFLECEMLCPNEGYCNTDSLFFYHDYFSFASTFNDSTHLKRIRIWAADKKECNCPDQNNPSYSLCCNVNLGMTPVVFRYIRVFENGIKIYLPPGNYYVITDVTNRRSTDFNYPHYHQGRGYCFTINETVIDKPQVFVSADCENQPIYVSCDNCNSQLNEITWTTNYQDGDNNEFYFFDDYGFNNPIIGYVCAPDPVNSLYDTISIIVKETNLVCGIQNADTFDIVFRNTIADFGYEILSCNEDSILVQFYDSSTCSNMRLWKFEDGTTSTLLNPTHNFSINTNPNVTLILVDTSNLSCAVDTITESINLTIPDDIVLSGKQSACKIDSNYYIINKSYSYLSYNWNVVGGNVISIINDTVALITWDSYDGGEIFIVISLDTCIRDTISLQVNGCCFGSDTNAIVFADTTISAFKNIYNGGATNFTSSSEIVFNGIITIDEDISFISCPNLKMAPNARFEILDENTLTINGSNISASDSCLAMWDGIYINETAMLNVINSSEISNAKNAIVSVNGGNYYLNESTLKENYIHLWVKPYDDNHQGEIDDMIFSCPNTLINPYSSQITHTAILIDSVYNIEIGNISFETNYFKDALIGINANNSNIIIENNNFGFFLVGSNLQVGVYATNNNTSLSNGITIRYNGFFEIAQYGIYIQNCHRTDINHNYINTSEGSFGTLIFDAKPVYNTFFSTNSITKINDNVMTGSNFACVLANAHNATEIKRNNITLSTSGTYFRAGIIAVSTFAPAAPASPLAALIPKFEVEEDTIANANLGMLVWNRPKNLIRKNSIELTHNGSTFLNRGIESWNNWGATVNCNNITGSNNTNENTQLGIEGFLTTNSTFQCNTIEETGRAINIMGQSQWTTLVQNQLNNVLIGIGIDQNGAIGQQGFQGGNTITFDNQWDVTNAPDAHLKTYTNSNGNQSRFFLRGPQGAANPWFPSGFTSANSGMSSMPFQAATPTSPLVSCAVETCGPIEAPLFNADEARLTILDSIAYPSDSLTHRWWARNNLYIALLAQDSLVNNDSLIGAFFDEYSQSNIVLLDSLKWAVHLFTMTDFEGDKEAEEAAYNYLLDGIDNITADNQMEFNLQTYAKRRLQLILNPENEDLMNAIEDVANQCVFYGGPTVLEARGFWKLNSSFFDIFEEDLEADCNMPLYRRAMFEEEKQEDQINSIEIAVNKYYIIPNPISETKTGTISITEVGNGHIEMYSVEGRQVLIQSIEQGNNEILLKDLPSGMYYYKVWLNNKLNNTSKLIIISQ